MELIIMPLIGGVLIGLSSTLMLFGLGKITGISGLYSSILTPSKENTWKYFFLLGLFLGGLVFNFLYPSKFFSYELVDSTWKIILAGLLVGFGTRLANGCTSGHGVCGISRVSIRSIIATITFIVTGVVIVAFEGVM